MMAGRNARSQSSQNDPEAAEQCPDQQHWLSGINYQRDGLISWRNHVACVLRDVPVEKVGDGLVQAIAAMEILTTAAIHDQYEIDPDGFAGFGFSEWLPFWQEHFRHWHDPVRVVLGNLCQSSDARKFADVLSAVDGEVLLDFLLPPCCHQATLNHSLSVTRRRAAIPFPLGLCSQPGERMIERLYRALYDRFTGTAPFATQPVPEVVALQINHDRLCPAHPAETAERGGAAQSDKSRGAEK